MSVFESGSYFSVTARVGVDCPDYTKPLALKKKINKKMNICHFNLVTVPKNWY